MYGTDTKSQFLKLRDKGWSLARIAAHIKVAQRTLVDWNQQEHGLIRTLRAEVRKVCQAPPGNPRNSILGNLR